MLENIILGIVQGIAEWLPVSSEGLFILIKTNFFQSQEGIDVILRQALFLHLGTFLAALIYFRQDIFSLLKGQQKKISKFLIISTIISGLLGMVFLKILIGLEDQIIFSGRFITLFVGGLLLITGFLQIKAKSKAGLRKYSDIKNTDSILLGFLQGIAVLPGLSRSGLTVSGLLLRKFNTATALKLSFLMSLPIVLAGNIILNLGHFSFSLELLVGLFFSFIFGLLTIGVLLKLAKKINFGYFILVFGVIVVISVFI